MADYSIEPWESEKTIIQLAVLTTVIAQIFSTGSKKQKIDDYIVKYDQGELSLDNTDALELLMKNSKNFNG